MSGQKHHANFKDMVGQRYGMLLVLSETNYQKDTGCVYWNCLCDCGNVTAVSGKKLRSGHTKSCGCLKKSGTRTTHNMTHTRIYGIYCGMKNRCYNQNEPCYGNYGGRGISVCEEWLGNNGFQNFYMWAIENGYSDKLTIDRIDNDGNYEPSNCRWADKTVQANNTRNNRIIEIGGVSHTLSEWCKICKIGRSTVRYREQQMGWDIEKALTEKATPPEMRRSIRKVNKICQKA